MINTLPRIQMAHLPTAIEFAHRLTEHLNGPRIYIKRDDQTGLALGGNKTRKLEFLTADALAHGARTLITAGALQSNHCRQTAAAAARNGLACILVLAGQPPDTASGNLLLDGLLGAKITWCSRETREQTLQDTFDRASADGLYPYLIPYGGSNAIGAAGYAMAIGELMEQGIESNAVVPDRIVFASSSGGTQAGLVAGGQIFGYTGKILGISVDENAQDLKERVADLASATGELLGVQCPFVPADILVNDDYLGGGYGVMGGLEIESIRLFASLEGILLDPVYTGRAAAGMIDLVRKKVIAPDETVLFWHTGGAPALFADAYRGEF